MTLRKEDTQICKRFHVQGTTSPFFTELHQKYDSYPAENESFSIKTVREADLWRISSYAAPGDDFETQEYRLFRTVYPHRLMTC